MVKQKLTTTIDSVTYTEGKIIKNILIRKNCIDIYSDYYKHKLEKHYIAIKDYLIKKTQDNKIDLNNVPVTVKLGCRQVL